MSSNVVDWVANKLVESEKLEIVNRTPDGNLIIRAHNDYQLTVAVLGVHKVIRVEDVAPVFKRENTPQLVVNVPSATLWSGDAIDCIHQVPAAFGTLGDVSRAASTCDASNYRDKNMGFFINAMRQHANTSNVSYVFDRVFRVERKKGPTLTAGQSHEVMRFFL